jgi:hypothetical protein
MISAQKLAMLQRDQFSSICLLAGFLEIATSTVYHSFTNVLHFKPFHLRRVPHILTNELYGKGVAKAKEFRHLFDSQRRIGYRDVLTGDES